MGKAEERFGKERVDQLVATYASAGKRMRRQRRLRRLGVAVCTVAAGGAAYLLATNIPVAPVTGQSAAVVDPDLTQYLDDRAAFAAEIAALEQRITGISERSDALESERDELQREREALAQRLAAFDSGPQQSPQSGDQSVQLDREIAALAAQREALQQRWTQFEAQGELLALEIVAVNAQRKELENQREQIRRQQQELAELIRQAEALYKRNAEAVGAIGPAPETTAANRTDDGFISTPNSLSIDLTELDDMRGGFTVGDGVDVSFGITQIGTVNGVEHYKNQFMVDSLNSAGSTTEVGGLSPVLLQNGNGNVVSPGVLEAMSDSFGHIIQNTLDDQTISTTTIYDISMHNIPGAVQGSFGQQALDDSLSAFR